MRFFPGNFWLLTLSVIVSMTTVNFGPAYAGGDPSIKDTKIIETKIIETKTNVIQHNHNKTSNEKLKNSSNNK